MANERILGIEDRLSALESNLQLHQAHQQAQHRDVADQISQIQHQVDTQGTAWQQHLDHKMEEQLSHIERLLSVGDEATDSAKKTMHE